MLWKKSALISLIFLNGCSLFSTQRAAPVTEINSNNTVFEGMHIVRAGQTLYEIAWEYDYDYRDLALLNNIKSPYVIYPGQKLFLKQSQRTTRKKALPKVSSKKNSEPKMVNNVVKKPLPISPTVAQSPFKNEWIWPAKGKIIKSYSLEHNLNKGIDISGMHGEEVKAAAPGKVVYSGAGLRGYGQLIIIKHDDIFLSAYAHNSQLLVKEGQAIQKGQAIAKMGKTDTDSVKLHFEIRKNGQPINPLTVLPKRTV